MAIQKYTNNVTDTIASAITSTGTTSISVTSGAGFPSSGNFVIKIDDELMLVTAVSGTTYTVSRGAEGTTAATHIIGSVVFQPLTVQALLALPINGVPTWLSFIPITTSGVPNNSFFVDSGNSNKLSWKDNGGTVHTVNLTP